jgi:RimJ/RimL family protein N-acetyltransferase
VAASGETIEQLTTPRLVLEPVPLAVAQAILAGDHSAVRAGEGWPHADTLDGLAMAVSAGRAPGWFVVLDGQVIGECGTHGPANAAGEVELGFGLAAPHRGRGLGKELVRAVSDWLLRQPGIRRLTARAEVGNLASRAVLVSAGFQVVGRQAHHLVYARDA